MSDHDAEHDPIDAAYAEAEAMLTDEAARADRRARVLAAVATEPAAARARPAWQRRGWLAAASVVGVGLLVATQLYQPPHRLPQPAAPTQVASPAPAPAPAALKAAPAKPPAPPAVLTRPNNIPALPAPSPAVMAPAPLAVPPVEQVPAPAPPPPAPPPPPPADADTSVGETVVVTAAKRAEAAPKAVLATDPNARLRAAAAAGRTGEVKALLASGVLVDATDEAGITALMRAVQADQPAAAALLVRHGADPDRRNAAGQSARDLAAKVDDPVLDKALGPAP